MAYRLEKERTTSTPYILIDEENSYMRFEGRSFHENVVEFYSGVNNWLDAYLVTDFGVFTFDCEMNYFNSSTSKLLHNVLTKLDECASGRKKVIVNWITTEDNDIIIECGEDFEVGFSILRFDLNHKWDVCETGVFA
jgi:hypothetical protein